MAIEVKLPQLGQTMEEGTIVNCLTKVGNEVSRGDIIFEVETDKAILEMESPTNGFVKYIAVKIGETIPVGDVVAILGGKDEEISPPHSGSEVESAPAVSEPTETSAVAANLEKAAEKTEAGRVSVSPRAKKLAKKLGVYLSSIVGSGPGGRIVEKDVRASSKSKLAAEVPIGGEYKLGQTFKAGRLQKITNYG